MNAYLSLIIGDTMWRSGKIKRKNLPNEKLAAKKKPMHGVMAWKNDSLAVKERKLAGEMYEWIRSHCEKSFSYDKTSHGI